MKYNQRKRFTLPSLMLCALSGLLVLVAMSPNSLAQTTIREYQKAWPTYPYSDANPVPAFTKFYPYCRFDGFADKPIQKEWKVVELSNEYLTLEILPEIGGKIWDVKEKSTGKSIIYSNPAIKFRDVGMRGPWTSGGIEFNVGIIGHTPNCSSPVDYATKTNADGSVSCVIGALDLIARAWWSVEINLPPKCSVFAMKVKWHNGSGQNQTYYNWTNVGVPAGDDLECIDPGTYHIGHDGKAASWPLDPDTGRNLAWYKNNNFGTYKSYHVLGAPSEFYGAYWHDAKYGVASYLSMDAKRGRKIWMWGLSRQGMIWENLLTDKPGGQYVEIQAGRLFNQCRGESSFTPFKDREFAPYSSELWTEYWMPVLDTGGFNAVSPAGSMNVKVGKSKTGKHKVDVAICPNRFIKETLRVFQGTKLLYEKNVSLAPTRTFKFSQEWTDSADTNKASEKQVPSPGRDVRVVLGENLLVWPAEGTGTLTRPVVSSFDQKSETSPTGLFYQGREAARDRRLNEADAFYLRACKLDPLYVPAYAALAESANRRGDWHAAIKWSRKALEIDTYCAEANYQFAFASFRLNQLADAKEGFALAALPDGKRSAALTALAIVYLSEKRYARSYDAAQKALVYNTANTDAMIAKIASLRLMSKQDQAATHEKPEQLAANMLNAQPLAFQARAELYLLGRQSPSQFLDAVRCELPHETFLELATWYRNAGRNDDAVRLLRLALKKDGIRDAEIRYWLAYLTKDSQELDKAEQASLDFCFPFRIEALDVFRWAQKQNRSWRSSWCLALTLGHLGYMEQAKKLLAECQQVPDYAPFYALRGSLAGKDGLKDIAHTLAMTPADARYAADYAEALAAKGMYDQLLELTGRFVKLYPINTRLVLLHARALLYKEMYAQAIDYMKSATFLPNEGCLLGRDVYRRATLGAAVAALKHKRFDEALARIAQARQWPENLGAGKPYPDGCDERLEDWLTFLVQTKKGDTVKARAALDAILKPINARHAQTFGKAPYGDLLTALALRASQQTAKANTLLKKNSLPEGVWIRNYFNGKISPAGKDDDTALQILSLVQELSLPEAK